MSAEKCPRRAPIAQWFIRRNPLYIISAVLMAIAARFLLVNPDHPAGNQGVIFLTLLALLVYQWTVGLVILVLHRTRRAPEDLPSLLFVAGLFWTGPLAATVELTALDLQLGTLIATGVALIAFADLIILCGCLQLRFHTTTYLGSALCLGSLVWLSSAVRAANASAGKHELVFYGGFWLFAFSILAFAMAPPPKPRKFVLDEQATLPGLPVEYAFIALVIAAGIAQLFGINHAMYCNAKPLYFAPILLSLAAIGFAWTGRMESGRGWAIAAVSALPIAAAILARGLFHNNVPVLDLPVWFQRPLPIVLFASAGIYLFGAWCHRDKFLMHAAAFSLVIAMNTSHVPIIFSANELGLSVEAIRSPRNMTSMLLGLITLYLFVTALIQRSRIDVGLALVTALAVSFLQSERLHKHEGPLNILAVGWFLFAVAHLSKTKLSFFVRLLPVLLVLGCSWRLTYHTDAAGIARASLVLMMLLLFAAGLLWRWTHYLPTAIVLTAVCGIAAGRNTLRDSVTVRSTIAVISSFTTLALGAWVSWRKEHWLAQDRAEAGVSLSNPDETGHHSPPTDA